MVATKTRPRKRAGQSKRSGKARRRQTPNASANGHAKKAGQSGKFATNQPAITGMEDTDERIKELDDECQRYFAAKDKQTDGKSEEELAAEKIGKLLHEHNLDLYVLNGKKFYLEPGVEKVKCVKVKQGNS
jgi:hypothetical protein